MTTRLVASTLPDCAKLNGVIWCAKFAGLFAYSTKLTVLLSAMLFNAMAGCDTLAMLFLCCAVLGWWQPQLLPGPLNSTLPIRVTPGGGWWKKRGKWEKKKLLGRWLQAWQDWCGDGNAVIWSNSATRWRLPCLPVCLCAKINGVSSVWSATFIYM